MGNYYQLLQQNNIEIILYSYMVDIIVGWSNGAVSAWWSLWYQPSSLGLFITITLAWYGY